MRAPSEARKVNTPCFSSVVGDVVVGDCLKRLEGLGVVRSWTGEVDRLEVLEGAGLRDEGDGVWSLEFGVY